MKTPSKKHPPLKKNQAIDRAREVIALEEVALSRLKKLIGDSFVETLHLIEEAKGRLIFCGIGKAGLIAQKISATFSSIGKPSFFLHPAEAAHGDLGMVAKGDLVIFLSKSGGSEEVLSLFPTLKSIGVKVVAVTASVSSEMASHSDVVLPLAKIEEACSLGLAPTTSTTQMLALGDALAMTFLDRQKNFDERSFALFHPGGRLGERLKLVEEVMRKMDEIVLVLEKEKLKNVLMAMTEKRVGSALVVDKKNRLVGIFSDGDLRRYFTKGSGDLEQLIGSLMHKKPAIAKVGETVENVRQVMTRLKIGEAPVVKKNGVVCGLLSLKDIE